MRGCPDGRWHTIHTKPGRASQCSMHTTWPPIWPKVKLKVHWSRGHSINISSIFHHFSSNSYESKWDFLLVLVIFIYWQYNTVTEIVEKISYQREDGALVEATSYKSERIGFQGKWYGKLPENWWFQGTSPVQQGFYPLGGMCKPCRTVFTSTSALFLSFDLTHRDHRNQRGTSVPVPSVPLSLP